MAVQSRIKAKGKTLVPNTVLKERPEPGSERSFPGKRWQQLPTGTKTGRRRQHSNRQGVEVRGKQSNRLFLWTRNEGEGAKALCFLMFWEHEAMPQEPRRVRRIGYFMWGKDIRQLPKLVYFWCSALRGVEHVTCVFLNWAACPGPITLAEYSFELDSVCCPCGPPSCVWEVPQWDFGTKHRTPVGKMFPPPSAGRSLWEESLTWLGPLKLWVYQRKPSL